MLEAIGMAERDEMELETAAGAAPAARRVTIARMPIDNVTMAEAVARMEAMIDRGEPGYVVTPNVDHVVRFQSAGPFRRAYKEASLVLADGMPLVWSSRLLGTPLKAKVSGSDLFPTFCETAAKKGYGIYLLGGRPGAADRAAEVLVRRHPNLRIAGVDCPPMGFEKDEARNGKVIEAIRKARPDVLFAGLGTPKGEIWIHQYHRQCQVPVSLNVGATFDFMAGFVRRAPLIMQKTGSEWLWRLMLEPRRLYRRYLIDDPAFFLHVFRQFMFQRRSSRSSWEARS